MHTNSERRYHSFFFFQAEDGIRDLTVTGVQTCALPISDAERVAIGAERRDALAHVLGGRAIHHDPGTGLELPAALPRADDERVAAEARHGGLEGCQRAQRRIEEQEPQDPPGQRARLGLLFQAPRELQERQHLVAPEVREIEKALHTGSSRSASRSRSTCCSSRMSGGSSRSTCGSLAVPVRMQHSSSSAWISFAGRVVRSPTSRPAPWCAVTGPRTQLLRIYALTRRTRSSSRSFLMAAMTASIAARSEEHTSELQSQSNLVCRLLLEKKKNKLVADEALHRVCLAQPLQAIYIRQTLRNEVEFLPMLRADVYLLVYSDADD